MKKSNIVLLVILLISVVGNILIFPMLPDTVPTHWNYKGEIDNTGSKSMALFLGFLPLLIYVLMLVLPKFDPKKDSYTKHNKAYTVTMWCIVIFTTIMMWMANLIALGYNINMRELPSVLLGAMFIVLGNYMSQIRQNYFFGIKTPWTLANEEVWKKTHRVGGYGFVISGILAIILPFMVSGLGILISIGFLIATSVFSLIYSYFIFPKP